MTAPVERERRKFILRVRQADGSWVFDMDNTMSLKAANRCLADMRVMAGIAAQVWPEDEARKLLAKAKP